MVSKRLVLAAVAALAVLAVGAASASAASTAPLPSTSKTLWTGVDVTCPNQSGPPCNFVATSTNSVLRAAGLNVANCNVVLNGTLNADGSSEITSGAVTGTGLCGSITLDFTTYGSWPNQACEYTGSSPHQMWDRLEAHFVVAVLGPIDGELFLHLQTAAGANADPLLVGRALASEPVARYAQIGTSVAAIVANPAVNAASSPYVFTTPGFTNDVTIASGTHPAGSCPWPELT